MRKEFETSPDFIKQWANRVKQVGLTAPAILALESHKPLGFILGQFVLVGQPVLNIFLPAQVTNNAVRLLSNRTYLERFIQELEDVQ